MCLDRRAMRSYAAWKGWQRRRSEAERRAAKPALEGGFLFTRAEGEGSEGLKASDPEPTVESTGRAKQESDRWHQSLE